MPFGVLEKKKKVDSKKQGKIIAGQFKFIKTQQAGYTDKNFPNLVNYVTQYSNSKRLSRDEIYLFAQKKSDQLQINSPGSMHFSISLHFKDKDLWKSGERRLPGDPVNMWSEADSGEVEQGLPDRFEIFFDLPKNNN